MDVEEQPKTDPAVQQAVELMTNSMRRMEELMPGYFGGANTKHTTAYQEYGYPIEPTFEDFWKVYKRNGIARGAIDKTINKTWQTDPFLLEQGDAHKETKTEKLVRERLEEVDFWAKLRQADKKSMVGRYAGVIFRFGDGKRFKEPVTGLVPGGLNGLVGLIPVYEGQLRVSDYDMDEFSPTYGEPTLYQFNESQFNNTNNGVQRARSFEVHPHRVHIWAETRDVFGEYALEAGLNSLLDIEKIAGAGGEGFWKNAKNAPLVNMEKDARPQKLADMLGVKLDKLPEAMNDVFRDWQRGFDQLVMLQGMEAKTLAVTLPDPEEFARLCLMIFSCSFGIPMKILVGSQTGERASTEDSNEWGQTCMGRRSGHTIPNIMGIVKRLVNFGILPRVATGWRVDWADLTEASADEKVDRAVKMADVNQKNSGRGEVYSPDEIREVTGHEAQEDGADLTEEDDPDAE